MGGDFQLSTAAPYVMVSVPARAGFRPDCDNNGLLSVADFTCFLQRFTTHDVYADSDGAPFPPYAFNVVDFTTFMQSYQRGASAPIVLTHGTLCQTFIESDRNDYVVSPVGGSVSIHWDYPCVIYEDSGSGWRMVGFTHN